MSLLVVKYAIIERRHTHMDKKPWEQIKSIINQPIVSGLLVLIIWSVISNFFGIFKLPDRVSGLEDKINGVTTRIDAIDRRITAIDERINAIDSDSQGERSDKNDSTGDNSVSNGDRNNFPTTSARLLSAIIPFPSTEIVITDSWSKISDFEDDSSISNLMCVQDPVAYDKDTKEKYTVDQLAEQKVLLYYMDNGQDVFFYGQFDDKGFCTGECTTNIYENGDLVLVTDAIYSQGKMVSFKKLFPTITKGGLSVWAISDRIVDGQNNIGETWYYIRYDDIQQSFQSEEVIETNIITTESFLLNSNLILEGYYCGNTSNGQFNDDTGNACLVKYFENGTVRTLYVGKIREGDFEDDTGNAWMIGRKSIKQANYSYYKGPFIGGESSPDSKYWIQSVSEEWINEYLADMTFNCKLIWSAP